MNYLLDTCVVSEIVKREPLMRVMDWLDDVPVESKFISALTIGEIQKGIDYLDEAAPRRARLDEWLKSIRSDFADQILPFDEDVAVLWGHQMGKALRVGRPMPLDDTKIAATALRHGMTLVTRNIRDMADFGVELFNPFDD
ncbi:MAG: type II toxin-antitoxin system VapC family toxin [Kiritimatiellae bacterium]|nr:type II toxin-antitoxin system VapC family toxin [Kiritimatiellia bacterium]